jgi:hypothetical protein
MTRWLLIVILSAITPRLASAQAVVSFKGWSGDGAAVVEINDPLHTYRTQEWARAAGTRTFLAACTPAPADAASEACHLCSAPEKCQVTAPAKTTDRPPKLEEARTCADKTSCDLTLRVGPIALKHALWPPRFKAKTDPHFRDDGSAVLVIFHNENEFGGVFDSFAVLTLKP